jgi:hypothetical protein
MVGEVVAQQGNDLKAIRSQTVLKGCSEAKGLFPRVTNTSPALAIRPVVIIVSSTKSAVHVALPDANSLISAPPTRETDDVGWSMGISYLTGLSPRHHHRHPDRLRRRRRLHDLRRHANRSARLRTDHSKSTRAGSCAFVSDKSIIATIITAASLEGAPNVVTKK